MKLNIFQCSDDLKREEKQHVDNFYAIYWRLQKVQSCLLMEKEKKKAIYFLVRTNRVLAS